MVHYLGGGPYAIVRGTLLTPGSREHQGVLTTVQFCNFCAICALGTRPGSLESPWSETAFRVVICPFSTSDGEAMAVLGRALGRSITGKYNGELPRHISPTRGEK